MILRKLALLLPLALSLALPRHAADSEEIVTIAITPQPPFAYFVDGKLIGVLVEVAEELSHRSGRSAEFKALPWARSMAEVRLGKIDAIMPLFWNAERATSFAFSQEPILLQRSSLFVRRDAKLTNVGEFPAVLTGRRVGAVYNTSYGPKIDSALRLSGLTIEMQRDVEDSVRMLGLGHLDIMPGDPNLVIDVARKLGVSDEIVELQPTIETLPAFIAFTAVQDRSSVIIDFDKALRSMKRDGTYNALLRKYGIE